MVQRMEIHENHQKTRSKTIFGSRNHHFGLFLAHIIKYIGKKAIFVIPAFKHEYLELRIEFLHSVKSGEQLLKSSFI